MMPHAACLLYSSSATWIARIKSALEPRAPVHPLETPERILSSLAQFPDQILLLDLQTRESLELLARVIRHHPRAVVIAFGLPGSDPMLQAEQWEVYAVEPEQIDRRRLVMLVQRAQAHLALSIENTLLSSETRRLKALTEVARQRAWDDEAPPAKRDFASAMRHFTNVDRLLDRLVDEVAESLKVTRVGLFCRTREVASYRLRAGRHCLQASSDLEFTEGHPLVAWLDLHSHAVTRQNLGLIEDLTLRAQLLDLLDRMGAEVLLPLPAHSRLLGWIFVGHLSTGLPYERRHLDHLVMLTECVSTTLENALLYEEVTLQKTLAETLLHSLPSGIIAVDGAGIVRWYNDTARTLFDVTADQAVGQPVEGLGSRLADLLRGTLGEGGVPRDSEWTEPGTRRQLHVRTRRLANATQCLGAVAFVQDVTDLKLMKERQEQQDRAAFWAELAASLSHEVRNPLVAIKTFAQLLPERYGDLEFQNEFKDLVSTEVERLDAIVDQIHTFAHPPALCFRPFSLKSCLEHCIDRVVPQGSASRPEITLILRPDPQPAIQGDERALGEAFQHLLVNAAEALAGTPKGSITITVTRDEGVPQHPVAVIAIQDNGPGIPTPLLDKIFSPFSTTKARGLGLGLPIARRTCLDHRGTLTVHSNESGVLATLRLPAEPAEVIP